MVKESIIPQIEVVRELEPEQGLTPEQKTQNQQYILNNLDQYIVDVHGNFFHTDEDMMVNEDKRFYIGQEAVADWTEITEAMVESIVKQFRLGELAI